MKEIAIVGSGFTGAVIAYHLAREGTFKVFVFDERSHVAGNCYTKRDKQTNILLHEYGPHIFHTKKKKIWDFVNKFDYFHPYINRVKAVYDGNMYSLPINLHTINQFFGKTFSPTEAEEFIKMKSDQTITSIKTFEEQALSMFGKELYDAFFFGYTSKQWGVHPSKLPASILKRLPVRFNYNDNYYYDLYQGLPQNGYTHIIEKLLDHPNIHVSLNSSFSSEQVSNYTHTFYSGPIDAFFDYNFGSLGYRTLKFERLDTKGDFQGNAVINFCDIDVPYTRITEHKYLSPWEESKESVSFKEYSQEWKHGDIPYYPIRLVKEKQLLRKYINQSSSLKNVSFVGRLGTYRYIDMDKSIEEAMSTALRFIELNKSTSQIPVFFLDPL